MASVSVQGTLQSGAPICGTGGTSAVASTQRLFLGGTCANQGQSYDACVSSRVAIETSGAVGQNFIDLDCLDQLSSIELFSIQASARVMLRVDAAGALAVATAGSYPTGFVGTEALTWTLDALSVPVSFESGDQSVEQVAARMNAAAALQGVATPRVTVVSGQLNVTGVQTGDGGTLAFSGTAASQLGLDTATITGSKGEDIQVEGLAVIQFPRFPNAPGRIQVSGVATLDLVAAGRASA